MSSHQGPVTARAAIEALITLFAWRIDHEDGHGVDELFTADGVYAFGSLGSLDGREAIAGFYKFRREAGPRTSRHLFSNLHIRRAEPDRVEGTCVLTLHAADGAGPHDTKPQMVADYDDVYVRGVDGVWRFERRSVSVLFGQLPQPAGAGH